MKNLPVAKKLLLGFGVIVAMILVILGVTVWTSIDRNNNLKEIKIISSIQSQGNLMLDEVNEARVDLRTVLTSSNYQNNEYEKAIANLQTAEETLATLEELTAQLPPSKAGTYDSANKLLREQYSQLFTALEGIRANDITISDNVAQMEEAAQSMATVSAELVTTITGGGTATGQTTTPAATTDTKDTTPAANGAAATDAKENAPAAAIPTAAATATAGTGDTASLMAAQNIIAQVQNMRIISAKLTLSQDISVVPEITKMLDKLDADAKALRSSLSGTADQAAIDGVIQSLSAYRQQVDAVVASIASNDELVAQTRGILDTLTTTTFSAVQTVAETVSASLASITFTSNLSMFIMIAVVILAILVSIVIATALTRGITRPLGKMVAVLQQAGSTGNLSYSEETRADVLKEAEAKDELGISLGAFAKFIDRITYISKKLEVVAAGDLTAEVEVLSAEDTMGNSLRAMIDNLNRMFSDIRLVADQVSSSSGEIANGSQFLAQGATEQASTIEEISANIAAINEQANQSAQTSQEVATDSIGIRNIAQQGNDQMQRMMEAVQEINTASQSIEQVIKVIDDIAFQTNILALNAAVEAARAGEHGKGFAVVADEVRSLAGKSSDAAKETALLISASVEKAELGLSITEETAKSLSQIVEGIQRTSDSLQTVSEQSQGACASTSQVNESVDQVAKVIQENSATSQQSAAASQELSSQAQMLKELIARFKLRGSESGAQRLLPPAQDAATADSIPNGDMIF